MAQKTPKWHTKNREHVWERYYFLYDFFKERILLVFVHNNLGKTGVLFEKLFSVCFCFCCVIIPQSTTQGSPRNISQNFLAKMPKFF